MRDPVHVFIRFDDDEVPILDSRPVQRLRHIHQLALASLLYPGATHRRFEHSLGVMELAGRVFDVIVKTLSPTLAAQFLEVQIERRRQYWRQAVRLAGLCHDLGHLPFSHAAEHELLREGVTHETLSRRLIESSEMAELFGGVTPPIRPADVVKLAISPGKIPDIDLSVWEAILNEVITGDAFGVDRMDYLLRDSHHLGVAYGRFDHYRLIDCLRILPSAPSGSEEQGPPSLGVEEGGLHSAEALLLARYFMYRQVYFHRVRQIYDRHLQDFLGCWMPDGYPSDLEGHLALTDNEVFVAMRVAAGDEQAAGHVHARRIVERRHFRLFYDAPAEDRQVAVEPAKIVYTAARERFGPDNVRFVRLRDRGGQLDFPVQMRNGELASSLSGVSQVLPRLPAVACDYVFVAPELCDQAERWITAQRDEILATPVVSGDEETET